MHAHRSDGYFNEQIAVGPMGEMNGFKSTTNATESHAAD